MKSKPSRMTHAIAAWLPGWMVIVLVLAGIAMAAGPGEEAADDSPSVIKEAIKALLPQADEEASPDEEAAEETEEDNEAETEAEEKAPRPLDINVTPQGRVDMHVRELDVGAVLQGLSMRSRRNIVATANVSGNVTANLYDVNFNEALTAILDSVGCGWKEQGNFIYVYTNKELDEMAAAARQKVSRLFRLHYTRAADIETMIKPILSADGTASVTPPAEIGIATSAEEAGGDTLASSDCLFVVDYPENLEAVARLIAELDVRPQQVLIEATILRARLNEDNALGIDFDFLSGVDFEAVGARSPNPLTTPGGGALTNIQTGQLPDGAMDQMTWGVKEEFSSAVPAGGFTFGIISNNVSMFIRALEDVTDTTVLANPKILALNKQRGEVIVGQKIGYRGGVTQTASSTTEEVEFLETGTRLIFRPFVGDDGYIRMEIHPEDSAGTLSASDLPIEDTTELTTNVTVRDGNTILIGGLFRESTSASRSQTPGFGNIPGLGALFRNSRDLTTREEVIILLTVHLIKDDQALHEASFEALQDVERYRVGMRQGLQWFGRQRLAHAYYEWAVQHAAKGHTGRALWDLALAVNNNPKFLAAIELKEKLLDQREWEEDDSTVRCFLAREICRERGLVRPQFGRPGPPFELPDVRGPFGFGERDETKPQASAGLEVTEPVQSADNPNEGDS